MAWTFFGLTPRYKVSVHKQIFELVYLTKGGMGHDAVYSMPVYLRNFYHKEMIETLEGELAAQQAAQNKPKPGSTRRK